MSKDVFEQTVDAIMLSASAIANDPSRATSPYYVFGRKFYDDDTGVPPQVRWRHDAVRFTGERTRARGVGTDGSLTTWAQTMRCKVWGNDFAELHSHTTTLLQAIKRVTNTHQVDAQSNRGVYLPRDTGEAYKGEAFEFTFELFDAVQQPPRTVATIHSATLIISSSNGLPNVSGSVGPVGTHLSGSAWFDLVQT